MEPYRINEEQTIILINGATDMKRDLYLIINNSVDADTADHTVIGAFCSLKNAVAQMREQIAENFEDNKDWWEDEEDEDAINEQYNEWIDENYQEEELCFWTYTDDDEVEHNYQILTIGTKMDEHLKEAYAVLHTCEDGVDNKTSLVGVYATEEEGSLILENYQSANDEEDEDDCYIENLISVEKFSIEQ